MASLLPLPADSTSIFAAYLPNKTPLLTSESSSPGSKKPFTTLTYAVSLDSHLAIHPGVQTVLSGPQSKRLTHYLRSQYDAILVGAGTAVADDPGLNCRIEGADLQQQPRPIVLDPTGRWLTTLTNNSRVLKTASEKRGKAPWVFITKATMHSVDLGLLPAVELLKRHGGRVISLDTMDAEQKKFSWIMILSAVRKAGLRSIMIEGGANVINELLNTGNNHLLNSVIVTLAPVYLGSGGVNVTPQRSEESDAAVRFQDVKWSVFGDDVVMAARPLLSSRRSG